MQFRKRNSIVEASQWFVPGDHPRVERQGQMWAIGTPEGWRKVNPGDWILTDGTGNSWPMGDREFRYRYEPAEGLPCSGEGGHRSAGYPAMT
ncbi:hypothetical protein R69888_00710 [Paraburkholderia haematera]|uniref:Uncharacterized protein n=1 Tax=Paraburkholderia haematera TaxID=2793077 RepID=A0ABM8QJS8_9BURK|nr:hypothetical protein R69888_00710 [Paraburkholderia haematera]